MIISLDWNIAWTQRGALMAVVLQMRTSTFIPKGPFLRLCGPMDHQSSPEEAEAQ